MDSVRSIGPVRHRLLRRELSCAHMHALLSRANRTRRLLPCLRPLAAQQRKKRIASQLCVCERERGETTNLGRSKAFIRVAIKFVGDVSPP
jgi:hypothetical protein